MLLALLVFLAMLVQDTAAAVKIEQLDAGHPWVAGFCEAANDVGASLSIGVGGGEVLRYGLSTRTLEIFVALALAAIFGTVLGDWLSRRKEKAHA